MTLLPDRKKTSFTAVYILFLLLPAAGVWKVYDRYREHAPVGLELNRQAWIASYEERGLPVPPDGPREGFWGARLGPKQPSEKLGWFEHEIHIAKLLDVDAGGLQYISPSSPPVSDIVIIGGSVAYGAYASSTEKTYFSQLAEILGKRGVPVRITIFAAGAWTSANELTAFQMYLAKHKPDVAVFLNGLNDLTQLRDFAPERRVADYLWRMRRVSALAKSKGIPLVIALQPFYPEKRVMSPPEKLILKNSYDPDLLKTYFPRMRQGMNELVKEGGVVLIDSSDALSGETKTTFSDQWHFSDPGHRLLAERLADGLEPVIKQAAKKSSLRR